MIERLDEIKNSTTEIIKSRISDPIIGCYLLSLSIIHWQLFLYVFSTLEVDDKIIKIKNTITPQLPPFSGNEINFVLFILFHPMIVPLYVAIFYLFLFPILTKKAHKIILMNKVESENDRFKAEEKLSPVQFKIAKLEDRIQREVERNNDLNNLKSSFDETIRLLKEENRSLNEKLKNDTQTPLSREAQISKDLIERNLSPSFKQLSKLITTSYVWVGREIAGKFTNEIPTFVSLGLIERQKSGSSDAWVLTDLGNKIISHL